MKQFMRLTPVLLAFAMLLMLAGCGNSANSGAINNEPEAPITNSSSEGNTTESNDTENAPDAGKSLVVYFSWSGNTDKMANWIADESGSEIYRVTPVEDYGTDYNACADRAKNELDNGIRPELSNLMDEETMAQYDTLYVGFPIWWYDLPMPMTSFLEKYDLSGKTIIPFFSHNGSSSGAGSLDTLTEICEGATVLTDEVLSIPGSRVENSETEVREWIKNFN